VTSPYRKSVTLCPKAILDTQGHTDTVPLYVGSVTLYRRTVSAPSPAGMAGEPPPSPSERAVQGHRVSCVPAESATVQRDYIPELWVCDLLNDRPSIKPDRNERTIPINNEQIRRRRYRTSYCFT